MAQLYFKYGAMGSSKTANALMARFNYEERGQKTLLCKPQLAFFDAFHPEGEFLDTERRQFGDVFSVDFEIERFLA